MSHDVSEASVSKEFHNRNGLFDWANSFSNRYIPVGSAIEPKKTTQDLTASEVLPFAEKNWDMCLSTESSSKGRIGSSWIPVTYEYGHELEVYALSKNHTQISCLVLYPMKSRSRKGLYFFFTWPHLFFYQTHGESSPWETSASENISRTVRDAQNMSPLPSPFAFMGLAHSGRKSLVRNHS